MSALVSNGADHLSRLPAYVINLDRSVKRRALLDKAVRPFVGSLTRIPGVDGAFIPEADVMEFRERALANPRLSMRGDKNLQFWSGQMGLAWAQRNALYHAIQVGKAPFLLLEDDARFYRQDLAAMTEVPDKNGFYIWGGARKGSSHTGPARAYAAWDGHINRWSRITGSPVGRHGTTAIEFRSLAVAAAYMDILIQNPHTVDISWWICMEEMDAYITELEVIQQDPFLTPERGPGGIRTKAAELLLKDIIG